MRGELVDQTRMRKVIGRRMTESKQQSPHFYVQAEIAIDALREGLDELAVEDGSPRITMTTPLVLACAWALKQHPRFNSVWTPEGLFQADEINIGVAIALDEGIVAPALLATEGMGPTECSAAIHDLVTRARAGRLHPQELTDATFTLSNLGMFEVSAFTAIVTPPQVAILATGRPAERLALVGGEVVATHVLTATLSADHRAVDGVDAARFVETIKHALEDPATILTEVREAIS